MKIKSLVVLVLGIALLASCSRPLADRMDKFVTKTEANYEKYSDKDWAKSQEQFNALVQEYKDNLDSFSKEEKDRINKAMGKYTGILLKKGISKAGNVIQEAVEGASEFLKGVMGSSEDDD